MSKLLNDVGVHPDAKELETMINALAGKQLHDLIRDGSKRLASVPAGGVASGAGMTFLHV